MKRSKGVAVAVVCSGCSWDPLAQESFPFSTGVASYPVRATLGCTWAKEVRYRHRQWYLAVVVPVAVTVAAAVARGPSPFLARTRSKSRTGMAPSGMLCWAGRGSARIMAGAGGWWLDRAGRLRKGESLFFFVRRVGASPPKDGRRDCRISNLTPLTSPRSDTKHTDISILLRFRHRQRAAERHV
jgi:hypothetical protein